MKNTYSFLFSLLIVALFCFTACKDDDLLTVDCNNLGESEICPALAEQMVNAFDSLLTNDPDKEFVKGFDLNYGDVQALYQDNDTSNRDTIYAMFAYKAVEDELDMILCIETPINSGQYRYFDFMQPCPNFCPGTPDPSSLPTPTIGDLMDNKGYWFGREGLNQVLGVASDPSTGTFLMLYDINGTFNDKLNLIVCLDTECTEDWSFQYCGVSGAPQCHEIE